MVEREGKTETLPCNAVAVAVGATSTLHEDFKQVCEELGIEYDVIGDAVQPRRALDATAEGAKLARAI